MPHILKKRDDVIEFPPPGTAVKAARKKKLLKYEIRIDFMKKN